VSVAKERRALGEITLTLRVQHHLLRFLCPTAGAQAALALAPGEKKVEEEEKKVSQDKKE